MKLAVLSDVHGNVPALEAVLADIEAWRPDEVIVNGDLINRGPHSLACLRVIQARFPHCRLLKGNHETFVLAAAATPADPDDPLTELNRMAWWTCAQLGSTIEEVKGWADHLDLTDLDGGSLHITHGSRRSNREGIHPEISEEELAARLGDPRALFIAAHTHRPFMRRFNGNLVVNVGSVGQPFDGDARASYGRFTFAKGGWRAELKRVAYDKPQAENDFVTSGFLEAAGPIGRLIHLELRQSRAHIAPWRHQYLEAVKSAQLTVAEAVDRYLASL